MNDGFSIYIKNMNKCQEKILDKVQKISYHTMVIKNDIGRIYKNC